MRIAFFALSLTALLSAAALPLVLRHFRRRTGFRFEGDGSSRILASDAGVGAPVLLRETRLGISGKPDYVLETAIGRELRLVPFEVKPSRRSQRLYDSDRVQLGAYLIALRGAVGARAAGVGYVRYERRTFEVSLTPELEREVEGAVLGIRKGRAMSVIHRSHDVAARCRACPIRQHCDETLAD